MANHELKTLQPYFDDVVSGEKIFQCRLNDRNYQVGDFLILQEFDPNTGFSGRTCEVLVTYIFPMKEFFNVEGEVVIMSIVKMTQRMTLNYLAEREELIRSEKIYG